MDDQNRPMTKKEIKALRRLEKMDQAVSGKKQNTIKWIILTLGTVIFLAGFAFVIFLIKQEQSKPVVISAAGWDRGSANASTVLVEYGDFQCPACKSYEPIVQKLLQDFDGKIKLRFKHFPLTSIHPNAMLAATAAEAAGAQGKFWEMHDWLYTNQDSWAGLPAASAKEKITAEAEKLKLDMKLFNKALGSADIADKVSSQQNEGISLGVAGTPTFYLNNTKLETPKDYEAFKKLIEEEIK